MRRAVAAEFVGALLLTAAVVGSGIMGERLAGGNAAVALLANTGATVAALAALVAGCCAGAMLANLMFELPAIHASTHARTGGAQWLSEVVATAGLVYIAFSSPSVCAASWRVPAWIGAAYWFTASTAFANPAITLGRSLSDTFAGIRPADAPGFIAAQMAGGVLGAMLLRFFMDRRVPA
jgi:glycerol uptake facilitator-like aquaporin